MAQQVLPHKNHCTRDVHPCGIQNVAKITNLKKTFLVLNGLLQLHHFFFQHLVDFFVAKSAGNIPCSHTILKITLIHEKRVLKIINGHML